MMEEKSIIARVGESFEVRLEASKTSGYSWTVSLPLKSLQIIGLISEDVKQQASSVGSSSVQSFKFEARSPGNVILIFKYRRSWEKDTPPRYERKYYVNIL